MKSPSVLISDLAGENVCNKKSGAPRPQACLLHPSGVLSWRLVTLNYLGEGLHSTPLKVQWSLRSMSVFREYVKDRKGSFLYCPCKGVRVSVCVLVHECNTKINCRTWNLIARQET